MRKVLVIDTSVLCVWLKVLGKETCGPSNALVTYEKVSEKIEEEKKKGYSMPSLLHLFLLVQYVPLRVHLANGFLHNKNKTSQDYPIMAFWHYYRENSILV